MADLSEVFQTADETNKSSTNNVPRWNGIYRGQCVDNKDPKKQGRIKVWLPELMKDSVAQNDGVWIRPASPTYGGNAANGSNGTDDCGSVLVPPISTFVFIFFEQGDPSKGWYFAGANFDNSIPTEAQFGSNYYNKSVIEKRPSGRMIMISDDPSDAGIIIRGKDNTKGGRSVKNPLRNSGSNQIVIQDGGNGSFIRINDDAGDFIHMSGGVITISNGVSTIVLNKSGIIETGPNIYLN